MADRGNIFNVPARVELATERCDLSCDWCGCCRGRDLPTAELRRRWAAPLPSGTPVLRICGGDPFRYGHLRAWVAWGRKTPETAICIEGPAASLGAADRAAVA